MFLYIFGWSGLHGVVQRRQRAYYVNAYIYSVFLCRQQGQNANFCRNLHAKDRVATS